MRLKNIKITSQIYWSLGTILLLVLIIGVTFLLVVNSLWQNTKELYDHPLIVDRAIAELQADVLKIRWEMRELVGDSGAKMQEHLQMIDTIEADVYRQFDIIYDRYLGPRSDIDRAYNTFAQYDAIQDETVWLLRAGEVNEAVNRSKFTGVSGVHAEKLMGYLSTLSDFAKNKGDQFYLAAEAQRKQVVRQLAISFTLLLLLLVAISYFMRKIIIAPIEELLAAVKDFHQGKLAARSSNLSTNEFGTLSRSFNSMADTLQTIIEDKEQISLISAVMFQHDQLRSFCQELLKALFSHTGSQVGAVYLLNEDTSQYEYFESIGLKADARSSFDASRREGEFGAVLAVHQIQHITDIPTDTQLIFSTVSGDFRPKEIITIPIIDGSKVTAVISLASIHNYSDGAVRLVHNIMKELTARFNSVLASQQIIEFSEKLQSTNVELEMQAKELALQKDELTEQNIELEMQKNLLDEASRLKSSFLSNMSHELRTPLNSVIALTSVLNRRLYGMIPEEEYSYLDVIERNGRHLLSLVNDILDLSRIEAGKEEISLSLFSVRQLVNEVVEIINPQAEEKGIDVVNHLTGDLPRINSDVTKCRHILQNIIGNAVKFTNEGKVDINAARVDNKIHISVKDTGIGISPNKLHYIFDEFRQADETTTRHKGGTGLGLAIAKKYAKLLGGIIEVESEPGIGSTFTLKLPVEMDLSAAGETEANLDNTEIEEYSGGPIYPDGQTKSILLVEDSEPAIIQMKDILTEQGYRIYVERSGKEAIELMNTILPDGIILDLMMPEVDGFQVLKTIRSVEKTSQIPVLILSAKHVSKEELNFLKGNNIFQLIQKGGVGKAELLAAVGKMVSKKSKEKISHEIKKA